MENLKKIDLLISLRPPTNYYSLKEIYPKYGINIQFLKDNFHSKFFIFYKGEFPFACIIGSSNFTLRGLQKNIETNAILTSTEYLNEIKKDYKMLWKESYFLLPTDLAKFKEVFDNFQKRSKDTEKEQKELQRKIFAMRKNERIGKEAKKYSKFIKIINKIKELVNDISVEEYPNIPIYISIDHFWHWIKTEWSRKKRTKPIYENYTIVIPKLFKEYCNWDKNNRNYTMKSFKLSQKSILDTIFQGKITRIDDF